MSADLFAQFGSFSGDNSSESGQQQQSQSQSQTGNTQTQQPADDPFAFLSSAFSHPPQQPKQPQQSTYQPAPAYTAPAQQQQSWSNFGVPLEPSRPAHNPQPSMDWGATGTWGSSIATTAAPAPPPAAADADEEDGWGDFEQASPGPQVQVQSASSNQSHLQQSQLQAQSQPQMQPTASQPPPAQQPIRTRVVRAPTLDLLSNSLINFGDFAPPANSTPPPPPRQDPAPQAQGPPRQPWMNEPTPPKVKKQSDPNVLFDVEDFDENELPDDDYDDDDDEFGDFETGHPSPPRASVASSRPTAQPVAPTAAPTRPAAAATSLMDLLSLSDPEPAPVPAAPSPSLTMDQSLSGLGFGQQQPPPARHHAASHLSPLSFGSTATSGNLPQTPKSPSFQERNPFPGLAVTTPQSAQFPTQKVRNRTPSPVTNWPTFDSAPNSPNEPAPRSKEAAAPQLTEDDWDAWEAVDSAPAKPAVKSTKPAKKSKPAAKPEPIVSDWDWGIDDNFSKGQGVSVNLPPGISSIPVAKTIPDNAPPPTNVPPPAILLSLFPTLMALPDEKLFKPTASQSAEVRNQILSHPKTIAFLRNYLQIIVVAVRVIAGRKQRWHRDRFLSQSMSISAAGSSKGGGMKLAGIDKTQNQREDREAADVVAAWRRYVGKLRSAVAMVNTALIAAEAADHKHYLPLKLPDLQSETVPVTTAKQVPTSTRPCVICGLKRDERVRGVDGDDVQDMFGEWWVEHWGHRACRNFWVEHEATLRSK